MTESSNQPVVVELQVDIDDEDVPELIEMTQWASAGYAQAAAAADQSVQVVIKVVDAATMQSLNKQYRQQDKVTNVLSFPLDVASDGDVRLLGDIAICAEKVVTEAKEQQKTLTAHWAHLVIHGVLHLMGFDHQCDNQAAEMESKEISALAVLGVDNPYV
ncbi:MAG: rRNA maturation RNase YbeY [Gammaproteobacteria bacterium]|nr:rRNA maturation RNase YbeY [Gammaproteobacteria bacterium]